MTDKSPWQVAKWQTRVYKRDNVSFKSLNLLQHLAFCYSYNKDKTRDKEI